MAYLLLERYPATSEKVTLGFLSLYVGSFVVSEAYTLEPAHKAKHGCLPCGDYTVICTKTPTWSRFYGKRNYYYQIRVFDTQNRGILIHIGNTAKDTQGCILVGCKATKESVLQSTNAYKQLVDAFIKHGLLDTQVSLKIKQL